MRKYGVLETSFARSASYRKQIDEAAKTISHQQNAFLADAILKNMVMNKCTSSFQTPINNLFQHLVDTFKVKGELPFVQILATAPNPPELLTSDSITFNFREAVTNPPAKLDGTIVNLTNTVRTKKTMAGTIEYIFDDIIKIQSLFVRAALCQSYLQNGDKLWLNHNLCTFIIESYNMIITNQLRQYRNITDPWMLKKIAFVNCAFMAQMLDKESYDGLPDILHRMNLGLTAKDISALYHDLSEQGYDFKRKYFAADVCEMYKVLCGDRMSSLTTQDLFRFFTAGCSEPITKPFANMMLEYPPYWVYQLLMIGSGIKQPVYNNIFNNNRMLPKIALFAVGLNTTNAFIGSL